MIEINTHKDYSSEYKKSIEDPDGFWEENVKSSIEKKWNKVLELDKNPPEAKWFMNTKLNITENYLDRHLKEYGNKMAFHWELNSYSVTGTSHWGKSKDISYRELGDEVSRFANGVRKMEFKKAMASEKNPKKITLGEIKDFVTQLLSLNPE